MEIVNEFNALWNSIKHYDETECIKRMLRFFGVPEIKKGKNLCVEDFLKADSIEVYSPTHIYDKLVVPYLPNKVKFICQPMIKDKIIILPNHQFTVMTIEDYLSPREDATVSDRLNRAYRKLVFDQSFSIDVEQSFIESHIKEYTESMVLSNILNASVSETTNNNLQDIIAISDKS